MNDQKCTLPHRGLYADRFDDGWYWVCDCPKCLGNDDPSLTSCVMNIIDENHVEFNLPHKEQESVAIELERERGNSVDVLLCNVEKIIGPLCGTENSSDDIDEQE